MKEKPGRWPVLAGTVLLSAVGFWLRSRQLETGGFLESGAVLPLAVLSLLSVVLFALAAVSCRPRPGYEENFSPSKPAMILLVLAAGCMTASGVSAFMDMERNAALLPRITAALSVVTGLCFVAMAAGQNRKSPSAAAYLLPIAYYILQVIRNFQVWSADPILLDYCYRLFAMIFSMLAVFFLGGFIFDQGKRRWCLFFSLGGVFFSAVSLAEGGLHAILQTAATLLLLLASAWQMLRPTQTAG